MGSGIRLVLGRSICCVLVSFLLPTALTTDQSPKKALARDGGGNQPSSRFFLHDSGDPGWADVPVFTWIIEDRSCYFITGRWVLGWGMGRSPGRS